MYVKQLIYVAALKVRLYIYILYILSVCLYINISKINISYNNSTINYIIKYL